MENKNNHHQQQRLTMTMIPTTVAVIFVIAALVALPYQNQVANAAPPMKRYQIFITLTGVPANAENLVMNITLTQGFASTGDRQFQLVSSPSEGEVVKFVFKVPSGGSEDSFLACASLTPSGINSCEHYLLPSTGGGGPIRVDYPYP
jgi:hypothetical protein